MKTHQLKALVALAENGSIRGAARDMGLSQSALTKTLRELETQTGAALLVRASRGTRFTPAGKVLVDHARLILTTMRRAEEEVRSGAPPSHPHHARHKAKETKWHTGARPTMRDRVCALLFCGVS